MITTKGIEKSVANGATTTWIVRAIDVHIRPGEFVSIMGPSGAGKSTLLHILGLHDAEWRGEYVLCDEPVHKLSHAKRAELQKRHIGFVFQNYHLIDDLTVAENLEVPLTYRNVKKAQRQALVADTLDRFHIVGKKDLFPSQLSGGQQQLVGVARAIIANPTVILADEPTGNLHSDQAREIMELFQTLNRSGTTIVQVTHSEVNANYGSRIIRMSDGWLVHE
ncbi:MAG TPA: ABC transporter ATP-binding protein [Thermoanaerobaculia bacterium]|nr:ABC transporter ATP-binding protein [Thermoanaerobaculia bacterium]